MRTTNGPIVDKALLLHFGPTAQYHRVASQENQSHPAASEQRHDLDTRPERGLQLGVELFFIAGQRAPTAWRKLDGVCFVSLLKASLNVDFDAKPASSASASILSERASPAAIRRCTSRTR